MPFAVPIIWRKPKDHIQDCHLCFVNVKRCSSKCKNKTAYPNLDSAKRPVSHDASMPVLLRLLGSLESDPDEVEHSASNKSLQKAKFGLAATFTVDGPLCYCHNIDGLLQKLSEAHIGDEWRLFSNS